MPSETPSPTPTLEPIALPDCAAIYSAAVVATPDGDLYTIEVETEVGSYNETHLLTAEFWIGSVFSGGDSALLTSDAAAQLLP